MEAGRLGEACQVAAAALVASMVEDGQAEVRMKPASKQESKSRGDECN